MNEQNNNLDPIEFLTVPEDTIFIDSQDVLGAREIAILGLKQVIEERSEDINIKKNNWDLINSNKLINLNGFSIQLVVGGIIEDEISVHLDNWYKKHKAPQILLAACVDVENNAVWFPGVLTGDELETLVINKFYQGDTNEKIIHLNIKEFKGGINRLLSFVEILEINALPRSGFNRVNQRNFSWNKLTNNISDSLSDLISDKGPRLALPFAFLAVSGVVLGGRTFQPRLMGSMASLPLDPISISKTSRGLEGINTLKVCPVSPSFRTDNNSSTNLSMMGIDKPVLYFLDEIKEIKLSKNGQVLWSKTSTLDTQINGPIQWPIKAIKPNEKYLLTVRPIGSMIGEETSIIIQGKEKQSLQKLDEVILSLGKSQNKWSTRIKTEIKQNRDLALALLFAEKAPDSISLRIAKNLLVNRDICKVNKGKIWIFEDSNENYGFQYNQSQDKRILQKVLNETDDFVKAFKKNPVKQIKKLPWPKIRKLILKAL